MNPQLELLGQSKDITQFRTNLLNRIKKLEDKHLFSELGYDIINKMESVWLVDNDDEMGFHFNKTREIFEKHFISRHEVVIRKLGKYLSNEKFRINFWYVTAIEMLFGYFNEKKDDDESLAVQVDPLMNESIVRIVDALSKSLDELEQGIQKCKDEEPGSIHYDITFAYTLRQMPINKIDEFLYYHHDQYEGDFENFLNNILLEYKEIFIAGTFEKARLWLGIKKPANTKKRKYSNATIQTKTLAIVLLLEKLGVKRDNITPIANLIEFLTGNGFRGIHEVVSKYYYNMDDIRIQDFETILPFFEKLNLQDIVNQIKSEIIRE